MRNEMKIISFLLFLFLVVPAWASDLSAGRKAYSQQDYENAEKYYGDLVRKSPADANAVYAWGNSLYQLGRYEDAEKAFAQALELKPDMEQAWYNVGNSVYQQHRYQDAVDAYERALELNPKDEDAKHNLEIAKKKVKDNPKADKSREHEKKNPNNGFNSVKKTPVPTSSATVSLTPKPTEVATMTALPTPDRDKDPNSKDDEKAKETARDKNAKRKYNSDKADKSAQDQNAKNQQQNQQSSQQQKQQAQNAQEQQEDQARQQQAKQQLGLSDGQVQNLMNSLQKQEEKTQAYFSSNPRRDLQRQEAGMDPVSKDQRELIRQLFGRPDKADKVVGEDW
jgi:Ca-activated chloride channel family protein